MFGFRPSGAPPAGRGFAGRSAVEESARLRVEVPDDDAAVNVREA